MSRTKKIVLSVLGVFVVLIVAARLAAPHFILKYVNRTLDGLDGYTGSVDDVDLHIWRGAYSAKGIRIDKEGEDPNAKPIPFIALDTLDVSIHWDALLKGHIVGELELIAPKINYVAEKKKESKAEQQREEREAEKAKTGDSSWQQQVKELVPLKINRIEVSEGEIRFRDPQAKPPVNIGVTNFRGRLTNLTNSEEVSEDMVATAKFQGVAMNSGQFSLDAKIDPYQEMPTFDMNAKLENLQIKELNDYLRAYANIDAERGTISVFTEVACKDGRFKGYVKPLIRDLRVFTWKEEEKRPIKKLWEGIVELGTEIFENDEKQQVATRAPFSGKLDNPQADIGTTALYILRNAFVQALQGGIDNEIGGGQLSALGGGESGKKREKK